LADRYFAPHEARWRRLTMVFDGMAMREAALTAEVDIIGYNVRDGRPPRNLTSNSVTLQSVG
jgi:hypothetical protein